jgi:hypothetical protein
LCLPPIQPECAERRFDGLAASFLALLAIFVAANPQKVQYTHSRWIGGKRRPMAPVLGQVGF